ncbi:MAG: hypothetical protein KC550_00250 [Nanoarchaeota archaeon]|nr:hypothetical protein [Nanoarchaeota archaeon]
MMNLFSNKKFWIFISIFFYLCNLSYSVDVEVKITETSSLTKLLTGQYSLVADGVLEIHNPSNVSKVYDFYIPVDLDALIGINKVDFDSSSNKFDFRFNQIKGYLIGPNETIRTGYHIFGLLSYNIYTITEPKNISVFEYYTDSFDFSSKTILNLDKPQREGFIYNNDSTINSSPTGNSTRVISAGIRNPTDFDYIAREMKLYKTHVADPFFEDGVLVKTFYNFSIAPFQLKTLDFVDENSDESSVYWVSSNVLINYGINSTYSNNFIIEQLPSGGKGSSNSDSKGGGNIDYNFSDYIPPKDNALDSVLLKKTVDKSLVIAGEEFEVSLSIVNINSFSIGNLSLLDEIPEGYEIKDVSKEVKIGPAGKLNFSIGEVGPYRNLFIKYTLKSKSELKGITYLKPAELTRENKSIFSDGVLVINDILPDKKVFVQKQIEYLDGDFAKVTIKVKNLGGIELNDILVVDTIDDNSIIKEISQIFQEKGVWKIKSLKPGAEWEVSYLIEENSGLSTLPNIFGVEKSDVYGTIISSEKVITIYREDSKMIERIGMGLAVGLLIFYLLF